MLRLLTSLAILAIIAPFFPAMAQSRSEIETKFDAILNAENLRGWMKFLSSRPHHVGSPQDKKNAEFMLKLFRSWGFNARIEEFPALFPTPKTRKLELLSPTKFVAKLDEPALVGDAASTQKSEQLPGYNAYSADGDVTGELVFVNYGVPADYDELERRGISVKGKIVIAKYGGSWRGIKPKVAHEHGAIGCLIYSDPKDDGYGVGSVYPKGSWRNENGVQRGSVADMPIFPGDPLTPGVGSKPGVRRLALKDAPTIMKIPVLPISYGDALPLLRSLEGDVVPSAWRGGLPITYHFGPGPAKVHLKLEFNWDIKPVYDVIAKIPGTDLPDEWIIRGNHHDAWVNGAEDPVSGLVALLEEARAVGELAKQGIKPKRTIIYCAWGGEEPGLIGSTEWVETHAEELSKKAVAYINTDSNGRGFFGAGGSHALEGFVNDVAKSVTDPETRGSVWERTQASIKINGAPARKKLAETGKDFQIEALGSGSDFTPFLQHLGIPSLNFGFGGENEGGVYHSAYDSFEHYVRFGDPDFEYGIALAKIGGHATLRLANADRLPFKFESFASTLNGYVEELSALPARMREEAYARNKALQDGTFALLKDPRKKLDLPKPLGDVPEFDFSELKLAAVRVSAAAAKIDANDKAANNKLFMAERLLLSANGLPRRDWFKHQIYAPGFYTGYGVKTLPAIREAIEQRNWDEVRQQIPLVVRTLNNFAEFLEK